MKKILFVVLICLTGFSGFSQTGKGAWLLGGSMTYTTTSQKSNNEKTNYDVFELNPKIGYFPVKNFALIFSTDYTGLSSDGFNDHTLTIGPAVRYYFTASGAVKFFVGAGVGFASASDSHGTNYQFEAGPSFFISPAVALEFNIKYQTGNMDTDTGMFNYKTDLSQFGIGVGFMIYLGGVKN